MDDTGTAPLTDLMGRFVHPGEVAWIGIRSCRNGPVRETDSVYAETDKRLEGDHYSARPGSRRQVTLIQAEHFQVIAALSGVDHLTPAMLRRNIVVKGINLLALKGNRFRIGDAELEMTGPCHPCSRMETVLGPGGFNAMRGHGGINARIITGGWIRIGDPVVRDVGEQV